MKQLYCVIDRSPGMLYHPQVQKLTVNCQFHFLRMEFLIIVSRSSYIEHVPDEKNHINTKNTLNLIKVL